MYLRALALLAALLPAAAALGCGGDAEELGATPGVLLGASPPPVPGATEPAAVLPAEATVSPAPKPTRQPMFVSLAWLAAEVAVPDLPQTFAPARPDGGLRTRIEEAMREFDGTYSVVVRNLADGRAAFINADHVYYAASLFKLPVLREAYRQRDAGLDFAKVLTLEKKYAENDLGTLEYLELQEGDTLTLGDAVKAMTVVSDTATALLVQDTVGGANVDGGLRALGIAQTSVNSRDLPTTAGEMARLLAAIAAGDGLSPESRREMLSLMRQEWFGDGILAGAPAGEAVAHKTGSYAGATHDVALVWGPAGPYVIAVLTDASYEWEQIESVSRAVWEHFEANP